MVLLYLLHRFDVNCTVAHCNYQLRGEESDKDMELVEEISAMWGFECITARFDPGKAEESNTQLWARDLRYTMFRDLKRELDADYILTAHHLDDQVETILQKILRGAGVSSWGGMQVFDDDLFRPLLRVSKKEITEFAESQHIPFRKDQTNETSNYARNLIRNEIAPQLDDLMPGWKSNILRIPQKADQFDKMTGVILKQIEPEPRKISRHALLGLPNQVWPALIHKFIRTYIPGKILTSGELEQTAELEYLQTGAYLEFGHDCKLVRDRDQFCLVLNEGGESEPLTINPKDLPLKLTTPSVHVRLEKWKGNIKPNVLQIDADKLEWPVTLRSWRDGDKIQPLGMEGHKLISDLLTDKKISAVQKKETFLLESFDGKICAVIFPHITSNRQMGLISEQLKCTPATKQIILIDTSV